jgi:trk system potassium uptake protein TrkA
VTNAYVDAIERRQTYRTTRSIGASVNEDVRYLDYQVRPGSQADGVTLRDLPLSDDAVIVAVRHRGQTVIPRGNTLLRAGDRVSVIALAEVVDSVRALFDSR